MVPADIDSLLKARGLTSFFDRHNLPPVLPWVRGLAKALNAARAAIILDGPHGLGNTQQYERELAIIRQTRDPSFPIVPVALPETQVERPFNFLQVLHQTLILIRPPISAPRRPVSWVTPAARCCPLRRPLKDTLDRLGSRPTSAPMVRCVSPASRMALTRASAACSEAFGTRRPSFTS
jgi:hypothetical protein